MKPLHEQVGSAFPVREARTMHGEVYVDAELGMTLRDYFAASAPAPTEQWMKDSLGEGEHVLQAEAAWRYAYADAMLAERSKP